MGFSHLWGVHWQSRDTWNLLHQKIGKVLHNVGPFKCFIWGFISKGRIDSVWRLRLVFPKCMVTSVFSAETHGLYLQDKSQVNGCFGLNRPSSVWMLEGAGVCNQRGGRAGREPFQSGLREEMMMMMIVAMLWDDDFSRCGQLDLNSEKMGRDGEREEGFLKKKRKKKSSPRTAGKINPKEQKVGSWEETWRNSYSESNIWITTPSRAQAGKWTEASADVS